MSPDGFGLSDVVDVVCFVGALVLLLVIVCHTVAFLRDPGTWK